jgi:ribosomal protein S18 acetylase RimI-like enzyme
MIIRRARLDHHKAILALAKQSKYTKDFGSHMFSGPQAYEKGWIVVAEGVRPTASGLYGFYCIRVKSRAPETSLYFIGVHKDCHRQGVGQALIQHIIDNTPHRCIVLNVAKDNLQAINFYQKLGFTTVGESLEGHGWSLKKTW